MPEDDRVPKALPAGDNQDIKQYVEQVIEIVSSWPGVTTGDGRFNSTTFSLGQREIGHVHPHQLGLVDISYPQPLREQLLVEGHTEKHHVVPNRATTFAIESEDDIKQAVFLLRLSYLHHASMLEQTSDIEEQVENIDLDVEAEIRQLKLSDELRAVLTQIINSE
ncbi:luciferase family protein [Haladaptatus pallidirubidus]|uniref:Luciferase domain-containing protein n=1 Tax=Haladaptatus pallidirubidus TaxID=1008152 RepID=A0AAV3URI8_9EURY|nr:luciferase family protein [Haladaptatus pallidirubidus]